MKYLGDVHDTITLLCLRREFKEELGEEVRLNALRYFELDKETRVHLWTGLFDEVGDSASNSIIGNERGLDGGRGRLLKQEVKDYRS